MKIKLTESAILKKAKERAKLRNARSHMPPEPWIEWVKNEEEAERWFKRDKPKYQAARHPDGSPLWYTLEDGTKKRPLQLVVPVPECFREYHLNPARFKDAHGGRGSGKSMSFARLLMIRVIWRGWWLLSTREIQDSIKESSKGELETAIHDLQADDLCQTTDNDIRSASGGRVAFIGLAKTGDKIKGYSKFHAVWVEEADNVSADSWKRLIPTVRKMFRDNWYNRVLGREEVESEIWLSWNPGSTISDTWKRFVSECIYPATTEDGLPYMISQEVNFDKNPFFKFTPLRADEQFMKEANYDEWLHVYGGKPMGALDNAIIKPLWVEAALDLHTLLTDDYEDGAHLIGGYDPGGSDGATNDPSALSFTQNDVVCYLDEYKAIDPVASAAHAYRVASELMADEVRYDVIGVGLGSKGAIRERNEAAETAQQRIISFLPFDASDAVCNPDRLWAPKRRMADHFLNAKAQAWGMLSRRFFHAYLVRRYWDECPSDRREEKIEYIAAKLGEERMNQLISIDTVRISPKILEKMSGELCAPVWLKNEGKMQVETKKMLLKRGIKSTNLADALVMNMAPMNKGIFSNV